MTEHRQERPDPIIRAMSGWQPARVLMTANRLDVFNAIGDGALNASELARGCACHPRSLALLLNACVALGFLEKRGQAYANTSSGLELLLRNKPSYIGDWINHADGLWWRWAHLTEAIRTNRPPRGAGEPVDAATGLRDFILAMHNRAMRDASVLADNLDLSGRRQLFDAGGGPGTYSVFLLQKNPGLRAVLFDLPPTIEIAREVVAQFGMTDRVTFRPGNYFYDDFGAGNDVVLFSAIFHALSPANIKLLLGKARDSLMSSGLVVVHEGLVNDDKVSPVSAVLFSLNMLVNTEDGRSYSGREMMVMMNDTEFESPRVLRLPPPAGGSLVIASKP